MEVSKYEICCTKCNMSFWITYEAWQNYVRFRNNIFCPNGHGMWINRNDRLFTCVTQKDEEISELQNSRDKLLRSNSALRGVITRMKKDKP